MARLWEHRAMSFQAVGAERRREELCAASQALEGPGLISAQEPTNLREARFTEYRRVRRAVFVRTLP